MGTPAWMVTYGDMMSLLLCFFVLLFSFSTIDVVKFRDVIIELQGALGVLSGGPMVLNLGDIPARRMTENLSASQSRLKHVQETIQKEAEQEGFQDAIQTTLDERGLMIRFTDTVLFDLGKADIKPVALPVLATVAQEIAGIANPVRIEGHTDPTPIHTPQFPSNWELSTARATAIVHYLMEEGGVSPERLSAAGYAFYHPVVPNNTPENRARNRRVDMIILKSEEGGGAEEITEPVEPEETAPVEPEEAEPQAEVIPPESEAAPPEVEETPPEEEKEPGETPDDWDVWGDTSSGSGGTESGESEGDEDEPS